MRQTSANKIAAGHGAVMLLFHFVRSRRAVPEQCRWPMYVYAHL